MLEGIPNHWNLAYHQLCSDFGAPAWEVQSPIVDILFIHQIGSVGVCTSNDVIRTSHF